MKMWVAMEVVVVLPWVPEKHTAFAYFCMMAPQACARSYTGDAPCDGPGDLRILVVDGGGADHQIAVL